MEQVAVVAQPPAIPSKWDIIPIHASDVSAYKRCRRYWDWTSPARNNLRRRVEISGIKMELWFGTGCHYGLEMYYDPILSRDPVESFKTWYELQVKGGIVDEDMLGSNIRHSTRACGAGSYQRLRYKIRGLRDMLPNWEVVEEEFEFHRVLGIGMMEFYKEWAEKHDDFVTIAAESTFSIPLEFEAIDRREDSPNYGKTLEVHARGKRDAVIYFPEYDKYGINDHKTAATIGEDYFTKLEKDEQITQYLWATMNEKDMPWSGQMIDRALYTALRKNFPKPPTVLKNGYALSVDRTKEGTTAELFEEAVASNPETGEWFQNSEAAQKYFTYLCETGDDAFIMRDEVGRNKHEIANFDKHLKMIAKEMLDDNLNIYPNPTGSWLCTGCAFRAPCIAADDGSDWQGMLADAYEPNRDR